MTHPIIGGRSLPPERVASRLPRHVGTHPGPHFTQDIVILVKSLYAGFTGLPVGNCFGLNLKLSC